MHVQEWMAVLRGPLVADFVTCFSNLAFQTLLSVMTSI